MPMLITILRDVQAKEYRLVRGKAIECASLVGKSFIVSMFPENDCLALSVGKDIFMPHASDVLNLLRDIQQSIVEADDPQSSYLIAAWARVCKVLGDDFKPYLDYVMKPLIATAKVRPDFETLDGMASISIVLRF